MKYNSIWQEEKDLLKLPTLKENKKVDVLIIGGGITGISVAYHLMNSNKNICLVEKNTVGEAVTAKTTGKLTYLQEIIYSKIKKIHGESNAKLYYESQKEAIDIVNEIVKKHNINCNLEKVKSYVFTDKDSEIKKITEEKALLESFGIDVKFSNKLPNNKKCKKAMYVEDTYVFHPLKYLFNLKKILSEKISMYENTRILSVEKKDNLYVCKTDNNEIIAEKVVFAIHYPYFLFPYFFPLKAYLEKSYIAAFPASKTLSFSAITSNSPTISIRYHKDINNYELYLTRSHNLCLKNNEVNNFYKLLSKLDKKPEFIWSNKDIMTIDSLPYIGKLDENLYIGTGYNTWGMTNGTIAGKVISDLILEKENPYTDIFNPKRDFNLSKIMFYPLSIASNMKSYIGSKINKNKSWYQNVEFKKIDGVNVAIYKDENNKEHIVKNSCPHMKCGLIFNEIEKTWDCPCHGSRFDIDGKCIEGPSNYDISYK